MGGGGARLGWRLTSKIPLRIISTMPCHEVGTCISESTDFTPWRLPPATFRGLVPPFIIIGFSCIYACADRIIVVSGVASPAFLLFFFFFFFFGDGEEKWSGSSSINYL